MKEKRVPLAKFIKEYSVRNKFNEDIPVYSVTNSHGFCTEYFGKEVASQDKTNYKIVPKGYFAYNPSRINVGSVDWQRTEEKVIVSPLYNVFSVSDELDCQYLYYFLRSDICKQMINAKSSGSVRNNLKIEALKEMTIPDIKIEEQQFRSRVLDSIKNIINSRLAELEKLDGLIKARFVEMFGESIACLSGWEKEPLGVICDVRDGTHDSPKYFDTGYPLVTSKNVTSGVIDLTHCNLISEEDYNKINERSNVDFGDIIMPMIGTVGKPVIVNVDPNFAIKNVALIKFKLDSKVSNIYIYALLQSKYFEDAVLNKIRGGTQKFISLGDIRKFEVYVPPLELQNMFNSFVEQVDKSKFSVQKSLEEAQLLFDSLMQKYFG